MNEVLFDAIRHNNWATKQLVVFCRDQDLSEEQLTTPGVGTFGGIVATLRHIITADRGYVRRLADSELAWVDSDEDADFQQLEVWAEEARQV
ncbi:MAG TPA: DinB family protein, partial [Kribbella sp.]